MAPLTPEELQQCIDMEAKYPTIIAAAEAMGLQPNTLQRRLQIAHAKGLKASGSGGKAEESADLLRRKVKRLEGELKTLANERYEHTLITEKILKLESNLDQTVMPTWVTRPAKGHDHPGVPTLFLSDLHAGEVIDPTQIGGVNEYNMAIFKSRLKTVGDGALRLLSILSPEMKYPGIVLALGGDLVNGNLREESTATNEVNIMPVVLSLYEELGAMIEMLVERFGRIFIPAVAGNHGRNTVKTWSSDRHATSFEWLLYCLLAKRYAHDKRITFLVPNGVDANYRIYDYRFCLTHGDAFRGGDGVIGVLGPVVRGDYKKRARNSQINMEYDTMMIGHFHQYVHLHKLIINGSLCGYNAYAFQGHFPFEKPCQALFLNHPKYGITYRMPVSASKGEKQQSHEWVSVHK